MIRRASFLLVAALHLLGALGAGAQEAVAPPAERSDRADSLRVYRLGEILVTAPSPGIVAAPGRTEVPMAAIESRDAGTAEALGPLLPATRVGTNSRGEALFVLRGASERQIALFHDGAPLNIPWDERVDLSLVPTEAIGGIHVVRGAGSVHDGPNALAGVVHLLSREMSEEGRTVEATFQMGEAGRLRGGLLHEGRRGVWSHLAALSVQGRDAFLLPGGASFESNQPALRRSRANSDRSERSGLLRVSRRYGRKGSLALSASAIDAEKGIPPETHLGPEARFWRVPRWRRALVSLQGERVFGGQERTRLLAGLAIDAIEQQIQSYPDSTYRADAASLAADRESGSDRTGTLRASLARRIGRRSHLSGVVLLRASRHEERLGEGEPVFLYEQLLTRAAIEAEGDLGGSIRYRAGVGLDRSETPETGDKPSNDPVAEPVLTGRLTWEIRPDAQVHLKGGRQTRFPSLRELYSGALGRFEPSPGLRPETQLSIELGGGLDGRRGSLAATLFLQSLRDGIVRVSLPSGKLQRRNEERIRSLGLEVSGGVRIGDRLRIEGHHTFLRARAEQDGSYDARLEGRPDWLSYLSARRSLSTGLIRGATLDLLVEGAFTGPRSSLDASSGRLARLPASAVWNLRTAWILPAVAKRTEVFLRVDNLLDQLVFSQIGLPEAGREVGGGVRIVL